MKTYRTQNTIKSLGGAVLGQLPASFLTTFNPEAVKNSMAKLSQVGQIVYVK